MQGAPAKPMTATAAPLTIYWVDVEGGAATVIVTPGGEVLLADTGFPGPRDGERVLSVLKNEAHAKAIDYLLVTHYHLDHVGNVPYLAERFPIKSFVDHGQTVETGNDKDYLPLAKPRLTVRPGDTLPLTGVELTFVASHADVLSAPLPGVLNTPNPLCGKADPGKKNLGDENSRSLGFVIRAGNFTFADLGDLLWGNEHDLACPVNLIGQVDLFQVTHHGSDISNAPQLVQALDPVVAVLNNGPRKGGGAKSYTAVVESPHHPDVWQLHRALANDSAQNAPPSRIANLEGGDDDKAHFIKAVVSKGTIVITNSRNGETQSYTVR
ncbi:MAG: MBL fold metallo-hydrolase [Deltaproteobacteria bacterium]|nr:MBL fold metallo-hydrolase [Deltaproteobacteria bacterium]